MDVLVPKIGEVIGGSAREDSLEVLDKRIDNLEKKIQILNKKNIKKKSIKAKKS